MDNFKYATNNMQIILPTEFLIYQSPRYLEFDDSDPFWILDFKHTEFVWSPHSLNWYYTNEIINNNSN